VSYRDDVDLGLPADAEAMGCTREPRAVDRRPTCQTQLRYIYQLVTALVGCRGAPQEAYVSRVREASFLGSWGRP
jgi:hypothetical protein